MQFRAFDSPYASTIGDLIGRRGQAQADALRVGADAQARAAELRGRNTQQFLGSLGDLAMGAGNAIGQHYADAPKREAMAREQENEQWLRSRFGQGEAPTLEEMSERLGPERAIALSKGLKDVTQDDAADEQRTLAVLANHVNFAKAAPEGMRQEIWAGMVLPLWKKAGAPDGVLPEEYSDEMADAALAFAGKEAPKGPGTREVKVRNKDGSETIQIVPDTPGQTFASAPPVKEEKLYPVTVFGPGNRPLKKLATEAELRVGIPEYVEPKTGSTARFWVIRGGEAVRITEAEYRRGDNPANTREQGRPVTSGDAGRIAALDTSLDDLNVLTRDLGLTGTQSKVGTMLPNWVTDLTGWGADAKARQAVIDRVKQVIGKALEDGVLRKEDERKYEKILPTIGDNETVAKSKIKGLWEAIELRRQTTLEALADANFDVSKFTARPPREHTTQDSDGLTVRTPDGQSFTFTTKAQAEAFKLRAGIK